MPIVATFRVTTPILKRAVEAAPGTSIELVRLAAVDREEMAWLFWAAGDDLPAFDAEIEADPSVDDASILLDGERRLYQVRLSQAGQNATVSFCWARYGSSFLSGERTEHGWLIRLNFPDQEAIRSFVDCAKKRDPVSVSLERLYRVDTSDQPPYGLTRLQEEAISTALKMGYFEVPRSTTLSGVADQLGISDTAASQRLRRGMRQLILATISAGDTQPDGRDDPNRFDSAS